MSIIIREINKRFGDQVVLDNLNLNIQENKLNILTGQSGCGKTTLLRIIAGLDRNYAGDIISSHEKLSYLFQEDRLLPWMNAQQNIALILKHNMDESTANALAKKYLNMVELQNDKNKYPSQLSGGMQRRVALARTLAYSADLVLLDEPFKGMNMELKDNIIDMFILEQKRLKFTAILVTHDPYVLEKLRIIPQII